MHLLETDWFLRLVKKSGNSPQAKLIGMFDVLADWLEAPQIGEQLLMLNTQTEPPGQLYQFLVSQAEASGAAMPEALANQLYFMLMCSVRDYAQQQNTLPIARQTAEALIQAQSQVVHHQRFNTYAIASFIVIGLTSIAMTGYMYFHNTPTTIATIVNNTHLSTPTIAKSGAISDSANGILGDTINLAPLNTVATISHDASPTQTAEMFAKIEQMRKGTCIFPEVLMLPQKQRDVYLQSVVHGEIPSSIEDQLLMAKLMEKVRCNYTPMLMQNSVG